MVGWSIWSFRALELSHVDFQPRSPTCCYAFFYGWVPNKLNFVHLCTFDFYLVKLFFPDIISISFYVYGDCGIYSLIHSFWTAVSCHCTMCVQPYQLHIYCFIVRISFDLFSPKTVCIFDFFLFESKWIVFAGTGQWVRKQKLWLINVPKCNNGLVVKSSTLIYYVWQLAITAHAKS